MRKIGSFILILTGFFYIGCKHDNNKVEEGSPASFNPVGTWEFASTPETINLGACGVSPWEIYSDSITVTQNGGSLIGAMGQGHVFGVSVNYTGTFSSNVMILNTSPFIGAMFPSIGFRSQKTLQPLLPDNYVDNFSLTLTSDNTAAGTEMWQIRFGTVSCSGTQTVIATKN